MVDGRWSMDGTARDQELVWSRLVPEDSEGDDDPRQEQVLGTVLVDEDVKV